MIVLSYATTVNCKFGYRESEVPPKKLNQKKRKILFRDTEGKTLDVPISRNTVGKVEVGKKEVKERKKGD